MAPKITLRMYTTIWHPDLGTIASIGLVTRRVEFDRKYRSIPRIFRSRSIDRPFNLPNIPFGCPEAEGAIFFLPACLSLFGARRTRFQMGELPFSGILGPRGAYLRARALVDGVA